MTTAKNARIIDMERISKMYRSDHRARAIINAAVAQGMNEHGEPDERDFRRFAHDVATVAVAALLHWIYDTDSEINRLAEERDHYKRIAEEAFRVLPATFQIKAMTEQFGLASADTLPKGQDAEERLDAKQG